MNVFYETKFCTHTLQLLRVCVFCLLCSWKKLCAYLYRLRYLFGCTCMHHRTRCNDVMTWIYVYMHISYISTPRAYSVCSNDRSVPTNRCVIMQVSQRQHRHGHQVYIHIHLPNHFLIRFVFSVCCEE